jgi:hypothetical protein
MLFLQHQEATVAVSSRPHKSINEPSLLSPEQCEGNLPDRADRDRPV